MNSVADAYIDHVDLNLRIVAIHCVT